MKISQLFRNKKALYSFEIFPPKPTADLGVIEKAISELASLAPDYISVTCSAGGSGNSRMPEIVDMLRNKYDVEPLAHLTCVNSTAEEIDSSLAFLKEKGVENILALRGDRMPGVADSGEFRYAGDLIRRIHASDYDFDVAAACYPECHPESPSPEKDIEYLKMKVDCGVTHLVTQLFFDNEDFYRFIDNIRAAGIDVPVQAGIMPLVKKNHVDRIISLSGAKIPNKISRMIARFYDEPDSLMAAGIAYATDQIADLIASGADGVHLYVMNNSEVARKLTSNVSPMLRSANRQ